MWNRGWARALQNLLAGPGRVSGTPGRTLTHVLPPRQLCLGLWHHSLLGHIQNPVPDVVRGHLPVSVNEAAAPTILAH